MELPLKKAALIAIDTASRQAMERLHRGAMSSANLLITGPRGLGKKHICEYAHSQSNAKSGPFRRLNCANMGDLFSRRDPFAHSENNDDVPTSPQELLATAAGGTIFLDHLCQLDVKYYTGLKKLIDPRAGEDSPTRIIAASHLSMSELREDSARADLMDAANFVEITIPALEGREQDISAIASEFLNRFSPPKHVFERKFSDDALLALKAHKWPENLRELSDIIQQAAMLSTQEIIEVDDLNLPYSQPVHDTITGQSGLPEVQASAQFVGQTVAQVERQLILDTLNHCYGNRTHAADLLGISIRTLRNKLKLYTDQGYEIPNPGEQIIADLQSRVALAG